MSLTRQLLRRETYHSGPIVRRISPSPEGTTSLEAASGVNQRVFRCDFSGHLRSCRSTASRKTDTSQIILPRELARFS
jgi:hypothetical protein